jgi:hypothetical protein
MRGLWQWFRFWSWSGRGGRSCPAAIVIGIAATCGLIGGGVEARAPLVFSRIDPMAEGGRWAEVYFSEQAEAGDPKFVEKIAGTQLWAQTAAAPGRFQPLTVHRATDRLRAALPGGGGGSVEVIGVCEYGVLARPKQTPFLLRHYPKAMAGRPDELNAMAVRSEIPLEIRATFEGAAIRLVALHQGKPVPAAVFHAVDSDLTESKTQAGEDGVASWTPPGPGRYSVYTEVTTRQSGTAGGKAYEEIRSFATLAFAWPLVRPATEPAADAGAVSLFEEALAARASWGDDFPGFAAHLAGVVDGRPFSGGLTVRDDGSVAVETDDPVARPWLQDQLESIVMHRLTGDRGSASPEKDKDRDKDKDHPVVRFADEREDHPLGRLLTFVGGQFASSYRVRDRQIHVVNRHMGRRNMTITVLDNARNPEGRFLPQSYLVQYWDAASGALDHVESVQERWQRFRSWDLPTVHTVTDASDAGFSVKSVSLSEHRLLEVK